MKLLIVESPNKIKKLKTFLDSTWGVAASVGHVCDLPADDMAIDLNSGGFEQKYQISKSKADVVAKLKAQAAKAEAVFLASDPDREGEAIAWHLSRLLKLNTTALNRVCFNSITKDEVKKALNAPRVIDMNLVDAYRARRAVDRIFGYQLSPEIQRFGMRSAGRCQTPCLSIVVQREEAITNFKPRKYFSLKAVYKDGFTAEHAIPDKEGKYKVSKIDTQENLDALLIRLNSEKEHKVHSINEFREDKKPRPPFITSTIITDAAAKLKFKPAKTTSLLQSLFHKGHITYIRTDSVAISDEGLSLAKEVLQAEYPDVMAEKPVVYQAKKSAQGAHECIRPTHPDDSNELKGNKDELSLYLLIRNRFLASQCKPQVFNRQDVVFETPSAIYFLLRNRVEVFPGFTKIYADEMPEQKNSGEEEDIGTVSISLSQGEPAIVDKYLFASQETKPPPRFKLATLSKEIERLGFGRPSTFSSIVQTPLDRGYYVEDKKGFLHPTETGTKCIALLNRAMPDATTPDFTKILEEHLDTISEAGDEYKNFMNNWFSEWTALMKKAKSCFSDYARENPVSTHSKNMLKHSEPCSSCGGEMGALSGKFGRFAVCLSCGRKENLEFEASEKECGRCKIKFRKYKGKNGDYLKCIKCGNSTQLNIETETLCPLCNAYMAERKYTDKKDGKVKTFYGCSRYPVCKGTKPS